MGPDFLWHLALTFHRQHSERLSWLVGYRIVDFDYEQGQGNTYQRYDLNEQGRGAGLTWHF